MNRVDQLERDLSAWFAETAVPSRPDYVPDILTETSTMRQRPRWTFVPPLSRPMSEPVLGRLGEVASRRRVLIVLALLGALLLGLVTAFVGSRPRVPPPFGPAANGLVAYEKGGDIFTVDPGTGERRAVSIGPLLDHDPRWSLDGRLLAFLRGSGADRVVVTDVDGNVRVIADQALVNIDTDSVAWSPDGRTIAVAADGNGRRAIYLVDVASGQVTRLPVNYRDLEVLWRPPDGRELMFVGGTGQGIAFYRYSLDDRTATEVAETAIVRAPAANDLNDLRPVGWTPDGARFVYHKGTLGLRGSETHVLDLRTGDDIVLPLGFGRISNDGSRVVGFDTDGQRDWLCIAPTTGGPCTPIDGPATAAEGAGFAAFQWAPNDRWLRVPTELGPVALLDPNGSPMQEPEWAAEGAASWQRLAP